VRVLEQLGPHPLRIAGEDLPGRDRVDENPFAPVVDRDLVDEVDEATLARRVRHVTGRPDHPVLGRDHDDPAAHLVHRLLTEHLRDGALRAEEDAAQVDRHDRVPVLLARVEQALRVAAGDAGVADHHVEPPRPFDGGADEAVDVVRA
jgi:hypothetical protein